MKNLTVAALSIFLATPPGIVFADQTDVPQRYYEHGLIDDAKREFIAIIIDRDADDAEKAKSLSALAEIAFSERKASLALATWRELIETYPDSAEAKIVGERIDQIGQNVDAAEDERFDNVIAQSYIDHGDWWSRGKDEKLTIDGSWIPNDKVAISWYERVIDNYPETPAATLALKKKFYTVYGWEEPGRYGETYGVKNESISVKGLVEVYEEIEAASPKDVDLQRFRYMIAQSYWGKRQFEQTREWLQKIIDAGAGKDGFYTDLAEWRMKKVEY